MSFRISTVRDNGSRDATVLIDKEKAVIGSSPDSDLQCSLDEGITVSVTETQDGLIIESSGASLNVKGKEENDKVKIRGGVDFEVGGLSFYVTSQVAKNLTPRKKALLSGFGLAMVWCLLAVMLFAPFVLDAKIKTHESKGRHALIDKCANFLDGLRETMKSEMSELDSYSQAHQDILKALNEEIEQMAWAFRNGVSFMSHEKMLQMQKDMNRYSWTINKLKESQAVQVTPLNTDTVLKAILPDK